MPSETTGEDLTLSAVGFLQIREPSEALKQNSSGFPEPTKTLPSTTVGEDCANPPTIDIQKGFPVLMSMQ